MVHTPGAVKVTCASSAGWPCCAAYLHPKVEWAAIATAGADCRPSQLPDFPHVWRAGTVRIGRHGSRRPPLHHTKPQVQQASCTR